MHRAADPETAAPQNAGAARDAEAQPDAEAPRGGRPFFPDLFAVEALVALAMLVVLVVLSAVTRAPLEETASRDAVGFTPRPEWYFLWFFQLLKYFKGSFEAVGTTLVPALAVALLLAIPFLDRRPAKTKRLGGRTRPLRVVPRVIAVVVVALLLTLTIVAAVSDRGATPAPAPAPVPEWPPQSHSPAQPTRAVTHLAGPDTTRGNDVRLT